MSARAGPIGSVLFLGSDALVALLTSLAATYEVFAPGRSSGIERFEPGAEPGGFAWNDLRFDIPLKGFWFQPGRVLSRGSVDEAPVDPPSGPRAVVGAKACDLRALAVLDRVFRDHTFREPAYCARREQNLVISGDCTGPGESCFCTMLHGGPHPTEGFDLNLSPVDGGYLVEVGSERGAEVVKEHAGLFDDAGPGRIDARGRRREKQVEWVKAQNRRFLTRDPLSMSILKNLSTRIWGELAAACVECNACNLSCPTCHCFLLHDTVADAVPVRVSLWDSCFHAGYARMAGGGTPRLQLIERFKNHYFHKFVSFPENWGMVACTGCGRCIDACMGRIDKRECLHRLETQWLPSEVPEAG